MSVKEEITERGKQRAKHLENPNYRRLSDIIDKHLYGYRGRTEIGMLGEYLAGEWCTSVERLNELVTKNLDNTEINWNGIYSYIDERIETSKRYMSLMLKDECCRLRDLLEPYRKRFQSTFVGF